MTIADPWDQRIPAFLLSPSQFLATTTSESFLAELIHELRNDKANDQLKVIKAEKHTYVCVRVRVYFKINILIYKNIVYCIIVLL